MRPTHLFSLCGLEKGSSWGSSSNRVGLGICEYMLFFSFLCIGGIYKGMSHGMKFVDRLLMKQDNVT